MTALGSPSSFSSSLLSCSIHGDLVHTQSLPLKLEIEAIWLTVHPAQVRMVTFSSVPAVPQSDRDPHSLSSSPGNHHWETTAGGTGSKKPKRPALEDIWGEAQLPHQDGQDSNFTCLLPEHHDLLQLHWPLTKVAQAPFAASTPIPALLGNGAQEKKRTLSSNEEFKSFKELMKRIQPLVSLNTSLPKEISYDFCDSRKVSTFL